MPGVRATGALLESVCHSDYYTLDRCHLPFTQEAFGDWHFLELLVAECVTGRLQPWDVEG